MVKGAGLALAQFKYSRNQEEEQIDPSEIRKILDKLVAARSRIPEAMGSVAQYFLVTNRKLSVGAAKAVKEAHEGQPVTGDFNENQVKDLAKLQVIEGLKFSALYPPLNQFAQRLGLFPD